MEMDAFNTYSDEDEFEFKDADEKPKVAGHHHLIHGPPIPLTFAPPPPKEGV